MPFSEAHIAQTARSRTLPSADVTRAQRRLVHVARQSPLLETRPSLAALGTAATCAPRAVFAGIGLLSGERVSEALPLDVLGLILGAESVRRAAGSDHLCIMVADTHAIEKGAEASVVERCAEHYLHTLRRIAERCGLPHMHVTRASDLAADDAYQRLLRQVRGTAPSGTDTYLTREVADIAFMRHRYPGVLKVGWALKPSAVSAARDERIFDACFQRWMSDRAWFVYTKSGRVFDDRRRKAPPYVTRDVGRRICLTDSEDVASKLARNRERVAECTYRGVCNHLRAITRTYSRLVRPLSGPLPDRTQRMIDHIMGDPFLVCG